MKMFVKPDWQVAVDDDGKVYTKYSNKRVNAGHEDIEFDLSFEEFCKLIFQAGLVSSQLGYTGQKYVLARFNDEGSYTFDNCRFITQQENSDEKVITDRARESSSNNMKRYNESRSSEELSRQVRNSENWKKYSLKRKEQAEKRRVDYEANADSRYLNENNSQFGSYWITNEINNIKWRDSKGDIPEGYRRGRVMK
jgi:hypothetical protein